MVRVALTLSLLLLAALAPAAQAASGETRIIVGRDPGLSAGERAAIRQDAGVDLLRTLSIRNTEVVTTDDPKAALKDLRNNPDVRYAEIDHVRHAFTNDPEYKYQWALDNTGTNLSPGGVAGADMNIPEAWAESTGSGVTVAIVDTVVQADHPDLAGNMAASANFVSAEADPTAPDYIDERDHGTHVAGIVAALRDNGVDVSGMAPDARIMGLRALDDSGSGYDSDIARAFAYAATHGARIVNASLGGPGNGTTLANEIGAHLDTLFVVAAGNDGRDNGTTPEWPCNVDKPNVICVGASTDQDQAAYFSNFSSTYVDLFAPGLNIMSTVRGGGDDLMSGTSMASPAVAAEAALVLAARPDLTTAQLKAAILDTVHVLPAFDGKSVTGGRADAQAAVASVAPANPPDADGDGIPNAADRTPRGPDADGDGVPALDDACPTVAARTTNGCPAPVVAPPPAPAAPASAVGDRDGDGRPDNYDLCPSEPAATTTGCPVPSLRSLHVKVAKAKHRATVKVRTSRTATVAITVERRVCDARGKHCRWRRAYSASKVSRANAASFTTRRLARGRYRVTAKVSSPAGRAAPVRKSFSA